MKNKSISIPAGMLFKKFYCHKCGERLSKHPIVRTVKCGDPEYQKHKYHRAVYYVGDAIEVREFNHFKCPTCENVIHYNEQLIVRRIQKLLEKQTLSEEEIERNLQQAKKHLKRKRRIRNILVGALALISILLISYIAIKYAN